jgi:hypothetical protein
MKTFVKIRFADNPKLKDIVIAGGFKAQGNTIMLDVDKKLNDSNIRLEDHKYHYITDVKLENINDTIHPDLLDKFQTFVFSGYYRKDNGYVKCIVEYKISE